MSFSNNFNSRRNSSQPARRFFALLCISLACLSGCAALTNPVANGIPVRLIPEELLAKSKEDFTDVPLHLLRQAPPSVYKLAAGDVLSVYVESVLGEEGQLPPINMPEVDSNLQPSVGFPIPVLEDGTLPLPLLDPINVAGLSVVEARDAILNAYRSNEIILPEEQVVLVTLIRPRQIRVLVIREDAPGSGGIDVSRVSFRGFGGNTIQTGRPRGSGAVVELPAYQNEILTALARTGGLPGSDADNEVIVQRATDSDMQEMPLSIDEASLDLVRIPLRQRAGQEVAFDRSSVILNEGDIVYVKARAPDAFYTGGLLPTIRVPLPRDEDIDVLEAISMIGGPLLNGGINGNNLSGGLVGNGIGNPSPSLVTLLRKTPTGQQVAIRVDLDRALTDPRERILVRDSDFLLMQETPSQAVARYMTNAFQFSFFGTLLDRGDAVGTVTGVAP